MTLMFLNVSSFFLVVSVSLVFCKFCLTVSIGGCFNAAYTLLALRFQCLGFVSKCYFKL